MITKEVLKDSAQFANFAQKLKMLVWSKGTGDGPMTEVALEMWNYIKRLDEECPECGHRDGHSNSCVKVE